MTTKKPVDKAQKDEYFKALPPHEICFEKQDGEEFRVLMEEHGLFAFDGFNSLTRSEALELLSKVHLWISNYEF